MTTAAPWLDDGDLRLYHGDALETVRRLPDESVDCVVTSPPYWGLRDYGTQGQMGLEETPDLFVAGMVELFREIRRVLAPHGTCWVNLGDSYANPPPSGSAGTWAPGGSPIAAREAANGQRLVGGTLKASGLKQKDLCGIPWRVAFALQQDGWWLRSDIVWAKPNPMPESVTDRPTKSHEYVFLLTKQPRYWFDAEAVREPHRWQDEELLRTNAQARQGYRLAQKRAAGDTSVVRTQPEVGREKGRGKNGNQESEFSANPAGRNVRSVWQIATQPYPEAHFATFPEELARRCILAGCPKGGTVLDPFVGSGTTLKVARDHQRKGIGIDLSEQYLALAARRLQQLSLLAGDVEPCGSFGCTLPKGHNRGRADVPSNHEAE